MCPARDGGGTRFAQIPVLATEWSTAKRNRRSPRTRALSLPNARVDGGKATRQTPRRLAIASQWRARRARERTLLGELAAYSRRNHSRGHGLEILKNPDELLLAPCRRVRRQAGRPHGKAKKKRAAIPPPTRARRASHLMLKVAFEFRRNSLCGETSRSTRATSRSCRSPQVFRDRTGPGRGRSQEGELACSRPRLVAVSAYDSKEKPWPRTAFTRSVARHKDGWTSCGRA